MQAIILHNPGQRIGIIQKSLRKENIETRHKPWILRRKINHDILNVNVLIICCSSPDNELLRILPEVRKRKTSLVVAVLDETENKETKDLALASGADLYFARPVLYRNMAIELKNLVAKKDARQINKWLRAFDIWLDLDHRAVKRHRRIIPLRNKEFSLLEFFIINRGKILTRNSILEHVWDRNANFASNTVDVHINRLRRKLDDPFPKKLIHTVHCVGYVFDKRD